MIGRVRRTSAGKASREIIGSRERTGAWRLKLSYPMSTSSIRRSLPRTVWRVLFGLGAMYLVLDFVFNRPDLDEWRRPVLPCVAGSTWRRARRALALLIAFELYVLIGIALLIRRGRAALGTALGTGSVALETLLSMYGSPQ
jgi:hypothetical protein